MLKTGDLAPEFILPDENGNEFSLARHLRDGPVILYFYPADFTPGCTREACAIRDIHAELQAVGLNVIGVSPQDEDSHRRFREKHDLPFTLISDPDKIAVRMYDAEGLLGLSVRRITYLIDQGQRIQDALEARFSIDKHEKFIRKAIVLREAAGLRTKQKPD